MGAPYNAKAVANFFLGKGELTQMKLHKLLYYAHGWHLGFKGEPLIDETIEAWEYGPVIPSIYQEFREFGSRPIDRLAWEVIPGGGAKFQIGMPRVDSSDKRVRKLLERVWEVYGPRSALQLSRMTHAEGAPWTAARAKHRGAMNTKIRNKAIKSYFRARIRDGHAERPVTD